MRGTSGLPLTNSPSTPEPHWESREWGGLGLVTCNSSGLALLPAQRGGQVLGAGQTVCSKFVLFCTCVSLCPVSIPSSLPTSDPVRGEGSHARGFWKLKRQRTTYESVDHMFSLPWLPPPAVWVSL